MRIVVTGPECTGKTTLARELAEHLGTLWVPEFARRYAVRQLRALTTDDVEQIARGQIALEQDALEQLTATAAFGPLPVLVQDTDLISTVVYAHHYYGTCPPWVVATARERRADLYLLGDIDITWEPDGIRDLPFARDVMLARFREHLAGMEARTRLVSGLGPARLEAAIAAVREELPTLR